MPDKKVWVPVQYHGGQVGQCPDDKEICIPVQRRVEYGALLRSAALSPRQITVKVVEEVAQCEKNPGSPQWLGQDADRGRYPAGQEAGERNSIGGDPTKPGQTPRQRVCTPPVKAIDNVFR